MSQAWYKRQTNEKSKPRKKFAGFWFSSSEFLPRQTTHYVFEILINQELCSYFIWGRNIRKATSKAQINLKPIQSAKLVIMTLTKIKAAERQKNWDSPAATDGGYWPAVRREEQTKVSFRPRIPQLFSGGSKKFLSVDGWRVDWQKNPGNLPALGKDLSRLLTGRKG